MYVLYVVEDDPALRELLIQALTRYGYAVRSATGDAFTRIATEVEEIEPHLILLDVNLPVYDGFHWARRIRMVSKRSSRAVTTTSLSHFTWRYCSPRSRRFSGVPTVSWRTPARRS